MSLMTRRAEVFAERLALLQVEREEHKALYLFADLIRVVFATPGCEREFLRPRDLPVLAQQVYDLGDEIERLRAPPTWQDGEPPEETAVWREGWTWGPVWVRRLGDGLHYQRFGYNYHPWGTARWMPIARPTDHKQ